jgi:ribosome-binding factor A
MKRKKTNRDKRDNLRGEAGAEDGADPRTVFQEKSYRGNRKTLQLCRQVQRALSYALGDCDDNVLASLYVESVDPAPNDKHLMVTVSPLDRDISPEDVLVRLHRVLGHLRAEIAADIHRKRVPELAFRCLLPPAPPEPSDDPDADSGTKEDD